MHIRKLDGGEELVLIDLHEDETFFDFIKGWHYPTDDHTRGYSTKGTYDIYWSRVQNIVHAVSEEHGYEYSDTFVFSALIEFYSSRVFNTILENDMTCLEAINKIGFYRRVVYNEKRENKEITEREEDMTNMVFDQFRHDIGDTTTKKKRYAVHHCKVNTKIDRLYGNMSHLGMKMVDLTNLIIMMAAIECDKYLSTDNRTRYVLIMRSFFESVCKLSESIRGEFV